MEEKKAAQEKTFWQKLGDFGKDTLPVVAGTGAVIGGQALYRHLTADKEDAIQALTGGGGNPFAGGGFKSPI